MKKNRLFLIDGTALAYRSYFAFIKNPLINSKGIDTSGIFGFTNSLIKILKKENPDAVTCVFDTRGPTFRHKMFPEYKATREKMPDELRRQFPGIKEVVKAFNIAIVEKDGFEADDVIGTLAKWGETAGMEVIIVSGDKDFMQLVGKNIKMYSMGRGKFNSAEIVDKSRVVEKTGVEPDKIIDLLGLAGDTSDNVPGVPGVGPKTAQKLLSSYGSLEDALANAEEIKGEKLRENLIKYREQAFLSKKLVTIDTDVPLDADIEQFKRKSIDREKVINIFKELEFTSLVQEIKEFIGEEPQRKREYCNVIAEKDMRGLANKLRNMPEFALDIETTSLDPMTTEIVGMSFSFEQEEAYYVPVLYPDIKETEDFFKKNDNPRLNLVLEILKPVLENSSIKKCGQNIKFDWLVLKHNGVDLQGVGFDTMVAAYLINPSARRFNLDNLALEYLNLKKIPLKQLIGTGKKQISMQDVDLDKITDYACEDADTAYSLMGIFRKKLKEYELESLFHDVEMPFVRVLMEMEENGVAIDEVLLRKMSMEMQTRLEILQQEIYEIAGEEFNINSTQQLGIILFEKLNVHKALGKKRVRRTKTGYSTDVRVLQSLSAHPLPRKMLDYRTYKKLKSTYIDALPKLLNASTGRIHASFNQTATATGRISTSKPNLQNIPIRTELGREIRKAFIPQQDGWFIVSADYSQIELRIMAHLSGDDTLIESFRNDEDVHLRTASEIFNIPVHEITDDHRRQAKTINFGIMYGMGPFGLAQRLGISRDEAEKFIDTYFSRYPVINNFISNMIGKAYDRGYVTTLLNRRRYLPELKSSNQNIREFGERTAVNTPIQGTAADLIKIAMIRIAQKLREESWRSKLILQIHDELLFEVPAGEVDKLMDMVREQMVGALKLSVPIKVDIGKGNNWFEAH